jgi:hypothetical protein
MSSYSLTIKLTSVQASNFYASNNQIMLAKPTSAGSTPTVIWLALPPLQTNRVTWTEDYGFYFSAQPFPAGASPIAGSSILINSSLPAPVSRQALYTLGPAGNITGPDTSQGAAGSYSLYNNQGGSALVGLTQQATVNGQVVSPGGIPMLADALMQGQTDTITPSPQVYIWAQSAGGTSSARAMVVTGGQTLLPFSSSNAAITVVYNSETGLFIISNAA